MLLATRDGFTIASTAVCIASYDDACKNVEVKIKNRQKRLKKT